MKEQGSQVKWKLYLWHVSVPVLWLFVHPGKGNPCLCSVCVCVVFEAHEM